MTDEPRIERAPTTEEEMPPTPSASWSSMGRPSTWPATTPSGRRLYAREAIRIRAVLGDRVRRLEHAGSTSVPGLAAKPVIDIVLAVADSSDEPIYVPDMEAAGYVVWIREPEWYEHRVFKGPDTNINLHTFSTTRLSGRDRADGPVPRLAPHPRRRASTCTRRPSASSPPANGVTSSTTRTRRRPSSRRSSPAPSRPEAIEGPS